jgi:Fe2+ or Zn2+ uptake regulation protein
MDSRNDPVKLRSALQAGGLRYTRQREAVFGYLQSVATHPTAEEVFHSVRRDLPNISLATVYKCLETLVACNLATKLTLAAGPARYDCRTDQHYHLRCLRTGQVRDLEVPHADDLLAQLDPGLVARLRQQGFQVTDYRLELMGYFANEPHPQAAASAADAS